MEPSFTINTKEQTEGYGLFIIEPLEQGYGHTLGAGLRRVLLTSLPGAAITQVKIERVRHPFSTIPGIKEDVIEFLLNLKKLRIKLTSSNPVKLTLEKTGKGVVKAGDIKTPPTVKIANPDFILANLSDSKSKLSAELQVDVGTGYSFAEERKTGVTGLIPLDALFSPVTRVNYRVESTRVGRLTNYDRLLLEIWTDGTIGPFDALRQAATILISYFGQIVSPKLAKEPTPQKEVRIADQSAVFALSIEELNIPARIANALVRGGYETVQDLVSASRAELLQVRNLGEKSLKIIAAALGEHDVQFQPK